MTIREAVTHAGMILGTVTVSGQENITKLANVFSLIEAVETKLAELERQDVKEDNGTV